jgi:hypothetical protein
MTSKNMGKFIIFDMIDYEDGWQHSRTGSNASELRVSMKNLGFDAQIIESPTRDSIFETLKENTTGETNSVNAFGCAICTHGSNHGWLTTYKKDERINVAEIQHFLHEDNATALVGKPKLLIVQACRGHAVMTTSCETDNLNDDESLKWIKPSYIHPTDKDWSQHVTQKLYPNEADILTLFAVTEGYKSKRPWLIEALTKECNEYGKKEDFHHVLVRANRSLCRMESDGLRKQTAEVSSTLRKDLFFGDFING